MAEAGLEGKYRGRDHRCRRPPAQIRTLSITSYGSSLEYNDRDDFIIFTCRSRSLHCLAESNWLSFLCRTLSFPIPSRFYPGAFSDLLDALVRCPADWQAHRREAVAGSCAANKLAVAIPCHRVVRSDGDVSGYHWRVKRKRKLIERKASANDNPDKP